MMTQPTHEEIVTYIKNLLSKDTSPSQQNSYDLDLGSIMRQWWKEANPNTTPMEAVAREENEINEVSPLFYDAAWELCLRGYLRPGKKFLGNHDGHNGSHNGYSITTSGRQKWLNKSCD